MADAKKKQKTKNLIPVGPGVGAYTYFHKPDTEGKYADNQYKVTLVLDGDFDTSKIEAKAREVAKAEFGDVDLTFLHLPFKSGDGHKNEEFHGKIIFKASSKYQPELLDTKRKKLPKSIQVKAGDVVRLVVDLQPWTKTEEVTVKENGKVTKVKETLYGVTAYLNVVQLVEKRNGGGGGGAHLLDDIDGFDASEVEDDDSVDDAPFDTEDGTNGGDF